MNLQIDRSQIEAMVAEFPNLAPLKEQLRFGNRVEVPFHQLSASELNFLHGLYLKSGPDYQVKAAHLSTLQKALSSGGERYTAEDLENVVPAMARYLAQDGIRGWLFTANVTNRPLPYVLTRLDYTPPAEDAAGKIFLELKANVKGSVTTQVLRIATNDIVGKTVGEIFAMKGFLKETPELIAEYDKTVEKYFECRALYGTQFSAKGTGFYADDPNSTHRDTDWTRKDVVVLSTSGGPARLVNDEGVLTARTLTMDATGDVLGQYLKKAKKSDRYNAEDEVEEFAKGDPEGPLHAIARPRLYSDVPPRAAPLYLGACRRYGALPISAGAEGKAGPAAGADRPYRHSDRRNGRPDGRYRGRQIGRHHGSLRRTSPASARR